MNECLELFYLLLLFNGAIIIFAFIRILEIIKSNIKEDKNDK